MACPVCGHETMRGDLVTPRVAVSTCGRCGHRVARHAAPRDDQVDYHREYDTEEFLPVLADTRRDQARRILARMRGELAAADSLLDFGAGRGWFVEQALAAGLRHVAGADTSGDAVRYVRESGAESVRVEMPGDGAWRPDLGALTFRPRILTMLDVIEHFPADRLPDMLGTIVDTLRPELELVVIKVPVAEGLLYRSSVLLARAGVCGPIEQLYQVGTFPPHESYFTERSLSTLLRRVGLWETARIGMLDFDPERFGPRVTALRHAPRAAARALGTVAAALAAVTSYDATVVFARPDQRDRR